MAAIIQFIHPGPEHGPDGKYQSIKSWNDDKHKRKFLLSSGEYIENDTIKKGELVFWGEWEPPSDVEQLSAPANHYPNWLHRPYLPRNYMELVNKQPSLPPRPKKGARPDIQYSRQNTDPFVFGKHFLYGICLQSSLKKGSVFTARLPRGSLILFGSRYEENGSPCFHLDTVFVVADYIEFYTDRVFGIAVSGEDEELYKNISLRMGFCFSGDIIPHFKHRLYRGATWDKPYEGMYSFSPAKVCVKNNPAASAFSPVVVRDGQFISDSMMMGFNANGSRDNFSIAAVKKLWESIRDQCRNAGCVEAVRFEIPPVKES
jgi:hypothetical protein